jgi:cytochrome b
MEMNQVSADAKVKVWDLPTRLFHWGLVGSVSGAIVTANLGGNWMEWHLRCGLATLALLSFRLVWGVAGSRYARFSSLACAPRAVLRYLSAGRAAERHAGHSPSGALAVLAFLVALLVQAGTGLFTSDSIDTDGPLVHLASDAQVSLASWIHVRMQWAIYALIVLHVAAIAAYRVFKGERLVGPMLTGWKRGLAAPSANDTWPLRLAGGALLAALGALVFKLLG